MPGTPRRKGILPALRRSFLNVRRSSSKALDNVTQNVTPSLVFKEAAIALGLWFIFYFVAFGILLGYKWQTKNYYQEKTNIPKMPSTMPSVNTLSQYQRELQSMIEGHKLVQKDLSTEIVLLEEKQSLMADLHEKLGSAVFLSNEKSHDMAQVETSDIEKLLEAPSMASLKNLESDFQKAIKGLKKIASSKLDVNWSTLDEIMKQEFPQKEASHNPIQCAAGGKQSLVPEGAARISDVNQYVHVLDRLLEKRSDSKAEYFPIEGGSLLSSSKQTVQRWLAAKTRNIISDIAKSVQEINSTSGNDQCMGEEQVLDLVEDSLTALVRKADLRNFLRKRAMELDPSAKSIILDADLPLTQPSLPEPDALQLRRVVDKPIIFEIVDWIDKLVDAAGGYNDNLDQYLDALAGSARASIGEIAIEAVLEKTEGIEVPHPRKALEKVTKKYISK